MYRNNTKQTNNNETKVYVSNEEAQESERGNDRAYGVKSLTFISLSILCFILHIGKTQPVWSSNIGEIGNEKIYQSIITRDGAILSIGATNSFNSFGNNLKDIYLVKEDRSGNLIWTKTIGGESDDEGYSLIKTRDGNFLLVGKTYSFGANSADLYIVKLSKQGEIVWSRTIGGPGEDAAYGVCELENGTYIVVGTVYSFHTNSPDIFIVNLDSLGTILWKKSYGTIGTEEGKDVIVTQDNDLVVLGYSDATPSGSFDILLLKINAKGDIIWSRLLGTNGNEKGYRIQMCQNGDFLLCGSYYANGQSDGLLIRCDSIGNAQYAILIGNNDDDELFDLALSSKGEAYVSGYTSISNSAKNVLYVKIDSLGNIIYALHYGGVGEDIGYSILIQEKEGIIQIRGSTSSFGAIGDDALSIASYENGNICYTNNFSSGYFLFNLLNLTTSSLNLTTYSNYSFAEGALTAEVTSGVAYNCLLGDQFDQIQLQEEENGLRLKWTCSNINEIYYFVIERGIQETQLDSIGYIFSANVSEESNGILQFSYYDELRDLYPSLYYRIKAVTYDNQIFYSPIQLYKSGKGFNMSIHYQPFSGEVYIFSKDDPIKEIELLNLNGKTIRRLKVNSQQYHGKFYDLAKGIYFLKITFFTEEKIIRMISLD